MASTCTTPPSIPTIAATILQSWSPTLREQLRDDFQAQNPSANWGESLQHYMNFMVAKVLCETEGAPLSPPLIVDEIWHLHLLDTAAYRHFCSIVLGVCESDKMFIDHSPKTIGDGLRVARLRNLAKAYEERELPGWAWPRELQALLGGPSSDSAAYCSTANRAVSRSSSSVVSQPFVLFLKTLAGKTLTVNEFAGATTVREMARSVEAEEGIPLDMMTLVFGGQQILAAARRCDDSEATRAQRADQEAATLDDLARSVGLVSGSTVHVILSLRGC